MKKIKQILLGTFALILISCGNSTVNRILSIEDSNETSSIEDSTGYEISSSLTEESIDKTPAVNNSTYTIYENETLLYAGEDGELAWNAMSSPNGDYTLSLPTCNTIKKSAIDIKPEYCHIFGYLPDIHSLTIKGVYYEQEDISINAYYTVLSIIQFDPDFILNCDLIISNCLVLLPASFDLNGHTITTEDFKVNFYGTDIKNGNIICNTSYETKFHLALNLNDLIIKKASVYIFRNNVDIKNLYMWLDSMISFENLGQFELTTSCEHIYIQKLITEGYGMCSADFRVKNGCKDVVINELIDNVVPDKCSYYCGSKQFRSLLALWIELGEEGLPNIKILKDDCDNLKANIVLTTTVYLNFNKETGENTQTEYDKSGYPVNVTLFYWNNLTMERTISLLDWNNYSASTGYSIVDGNFYYIGGR